MFSQLTLSQLWIFSIGILLVYMAISRLLMQLFCYVPFNFHFFEPPLVALNQFWGVHQTFLSEVSNAPNKVLFEALLQTLTGVFVCIYLLFSFQGLNLSVKRKLPYVLILLVSLAAFPATLLSMYGLPLILVYFALLLLRTVHYWYPQKVSLFQKEQSTFSLEDHLILSGFYEKIVATSTILPLALTCRFFTDDWYIIFFIMLPCFFSVGIISGYNYKRIRGLLQYSDLNLKFLKKCHLFFKFSLLILSYFFATQNFIEPFFVLPVWFLIFVIFPNPLFLAIPLIILGIFAGASLKKVPVS